MLTLRLIALALSAGVVLSSIGCATIVNGPTQQMSFQSIPDGATVTMVGTYRGSLGFMSGAKPPDQLVLGKTPLAVQLPRSAWAQTVVLSKDGYHDVAVKLEHRTSGWFWGNILVGWYLGSTTDGVSGSATEYAPNQFFTSLYKIGSNPLEQETRLTAKEQTKIFFIRRYDAIMSDVSRESGEDLRALLSRLRIDTSKEAAAKIWLTKLSETYADIAEFASHVVEPYWPENPTRAVAANVGDVAKQRPTTYGGAR